MRSVVVVLPASMCAMMPMFRVRLSGVCRGIAADSCWLRASGFGLQVLPAVVGKRLVRFRHPVRVLALLHGAAAEIRRIEELVGELLLHGLAVAAGIRVAHQPADAERQAAV